MSSRRNLLSALAALTLASVPAAGQAAESASVTVHLDALDAPGSQLAQLPSLLANMNSELRESLRRCLEDELQAENLPPEMLLEALLRNEVRTISCISALNVGIATTPNSSRNYVQQAEIY